MSWRADDSIEGALRTMGEHQVRRLPVIDGRDLVGIVSQADIARNYDEEKVGDHPRAVGAAWRPRARRRCCACATASPTSRSASGRGGGYANDVFRARGDGARRNLGSLERL